MISQSSSAAVLFGKSVGKMLFFLSLLPAVVTYLHLREQLRTSVTLNDVLIVGGDAPRHASGLYGRRNDATPPYYHKLLVVPTGVSQPDVVDAALAVVVRSVGDHLPYLVPAVESPGKVPCLHVTDETVLCGNDGLVVKHAVQLSPTNRHSPKHKTLYLVTSQIPATSLLIALNVLLAFLYWNGHVPVNTVAKMYGCMVHAPFEIWRSFTGATAHFEIWHLGLNMMSLSALGTELEGLNLYSSTVFLLYNLSLIPLITALWLGLQWAAGKYHGSNSTTASDPNRPTVGYSGVLFAWMVVASLEQQSTCPVIFLPSLCFRTYQWGAMKFSFAPLVQLVILQVILPRVSLTGHLAGILAGFLLHWGLLPIRFAQPSILIPALYLVYLRTIRQLIPAAADDVSERSLGQCETSSRRKFLFRCQLIVLVCSIATLGPFSSLSLSFALTVVYWHLYCKASDRKSFSDSLNETAVLTKGYIVAAVLVLITDAMTVGSWHAFYSWSRFPVAVMMLRALALLSSIFAAQINLVPEGSGIFEWTLGYTTLQPCKALAGHPWLSKLTTRNTTAVGDIEANGGTWSPFAGGGRRLGGERPRRTPQDNSLEEGTTQEMSRLLRSQPEG
jgi:membrane associated rhomboid family serine protease